VTAISITWRDCSPDDRAGQAHPDKQHVLVGILAAFVQPGQDGDRYVGGRLPGAAFLSPGEVINVRLEDV